jgi:hypothetical protein
MFGGRQNNLGLGLANPPFGSSLAARVVTGRLFFMSRQLVAQSLHQSGGLEAAAMIAPGATRGAPPAGTVATSGSRKACGFEGCSDHGVWVERNVIPPPLFWLSEESCRPAQLRFYPFRLATIGI